MKFKKLISVVVLVVLVVGCFVGCKDNSNIGKDGIKEYTMFMFATPPYNADMPIWKYAEEKTGIRLVGTVSETASQEGVEFNTMLTSSELPDVIRHKTDGLRELANDGGLVPLNELIDEYAPNIKKFFENCPEGKAIATLDDGKIYFIPGTLSEVDIKASPSEAYFIRTDWLNKLGLKVPKTIEEYHDVLLAFATKDPNGNGIKDEVPFFDENKSLQRLLPLFNAGNGFVYNEKCDDIIYSPITEEYKYAMNELAKWYKEGIIDKEIFSRTNARKQLLGQNLGGSTSHWIGSTSNIAAAAAKTHTEMKFDIMLPPADITGRVVAKRSRGLLHGFAWGISKDTTKEEQIDLIKYFDFWMSEEGSTLYSYGVEGVSYEKDANGNLTWTEAALAHEGGVPEYRRVIGAAENGSIAQLEVEKSSMNEGARKGFEMYESIVQPPVPTLCFNMEEIKIRDKYNTNISTAVEEQQQKWIMGKEDVNETWDKYIKTLKSMGVDEIIKINKDAYTRMYK